MISGCFMFSTIIMFSTLILGLETTRSKKSFWNRLSKVTLSAVLVLVNLEVEVMSQGTKVYLHMCLFLGCAVLDMSSQSHKPAILSCLVVRQLSGSHKAVVR